MRILLQISMNLRDFWIIGPLKWPDSVYEGRLMDLFGPNHTICLGGGYEISLSNSWMWIDISKDVGKYSKIRSFKSLYDEIASMIKYYQVFEEE